MTEPSGEFLLELRARAAKCHRSVVFPEGAEPRIQRAVAEALADELCHPILIGRPEDVAAGLAECGVDRDRVEILDPEDSARRAGCAETLTQLLADRSLAPEQIDGMAGDPLVQAGLLLRDGGADGVVAGAVRTTGDVVRAALSCVGLAQGVDTLSSAFFMILGLEHHMGPSVLTFTDAGVVPEPTAEQLAQSAVQAAAAHRHVVGEEPRVAFLSYSTKGSAEGASVSLVREATALFRALEPNVAADGELQADAALVPDVADHKAPGSPVGGRANVLVFPDLAAANIAYKLVQHLGAAQALGPVLQGLARPYNDLSRGADPSDITHVACITALMAG